MLVYYAIIKKDYEFEFEWKWGSTATAVRKTHEKNLKERREGEKQCNYILI